jgi:hypothetical protein
MSPTLLTWTMQAEQDLSDYSLLASIPSAFALMLSRLQY